MAEEKPTKAGLVDRLYLAYKTARGQMVPFSGWGGGTGLGSVYPISNDIARASVDQAIRRFAGSKVDYQREIGDPTTSSLVMAAVNWFGTTLPEAPIQVTEKKNAEEVAVDDHELVTLLDRPNPYYSGELIWKAFSLSWLINGNVYWLKTRNGAGKVVQLWPEPYFTIRARWPTNGGDFISFYEVQRDSRWYSIDVADVVHFRYGIDPYNPRYGLSPIGSVLREIFTDNEAANYAALLMKNCGVPPVVLSPKDSASAVSPEKAKEMTAEIERKMTGDSRGKPLFLGGPIDIELLGWDPKKMDLSAIRRIPESRLAAAIGIPAMVLNFIVGLEHSTMANYKEAREAAYESFVIPTQRVIGSDLRVQLLPEFDKNTKRRVSFEHSKVRVLQEDQNNLYKRVGLAYKDEFMKRGEARAAVGLKVDPAVDDVYLSEASASLGGSFLDALDRTDDDAPPDQPVNGKAL